MDDFIFLRQCLKPALPTYGSLSNSALNIPLISNKTVPQAMCVTVHGYEVDTIAMQIRLPPDKLETAKQDLSNLLIGK